MKTFDQLLDLVRKTGLRNRNGDLQFSADYLPYLNLCFSSCGEDLWLSKFMKAKLRSGQPGFYIDLGAGRPLHMSTTFLFYIYGWRGVCIDANPRYFPEFVQWRPRDILVNAAVSDTNRPLYFAEHKGFWAMSSVKDRAEDFDDNFHPACEVEAMTLADIFRENVPQNTVIDFMSVDLEDSELPALRSNDWSIYKPRVILIECGTGFDALAPLGFPTLSFLRDLGYTYRGFSSNNVLMTSAEFDTAP
jgi:FkbM family methyltransferase